MQVAAVEAEATTLILNFAAVEAVLKGALNILGTELFWKHHNLHAF